MGLAREEGTLLVTEGAPDRWSLGCQRPTLQIQGCPLPGHPSVDKQRLQERSGQDAFES